MKMENTDMKQASDNMTCKKKGISKLGRKGDPRMHRAVAARLANPQITLLEALTMGGFEFPANEGDDGTLLDLDQVTLGQRKNQLSRRLRLAKQSTEHHNSDGSLTSTESNNKRRKSSGVSAQAQAEYEKLMSQRNKKVLKRALSISDEAVDDTANEMEHVTETPSRMAKFHPNFHPLFVAPPRTTSWQQQQEQTTEASVNQEQQPECPTNAAAFSSTNFAHLHPSQQQQQQPPSGVAISSLNATASAVGMTLEQLAMALSSTPNLGMVLRHQTDDVSQSKQALALNLYKHERLAMYKRCMLLAGFDSHETNEDHPARVQFALEAWQLEGEQLRQRMDSSDNNEDNSEGSESDHFHSHSHSHSNAAQEGCFGGRHVHRLEGKCGHKAIVHQPEDAPAHVDFVVDGKVECYQGIKPVGSKPRGSNAALWPSRFKCDQIACDDSNHHTVTCGAQNCENECGGANKKDPKTLQLSGIDLEGKEWNSDFFSTTNGQVDDSLLGLIGLGDKSSDEA